MKAGNKKVRILLVEDELSYRALLQRTFVQSGYQCTGCIDGEYAIEKLKKEQFDILVLDYILPGHNALEIIRWAREQHIYAPAIVITAYPSDALVEQCKAEKNVVLAIKANVSPQTILEMIAKIVSSQ